MDPTILSTPLVSIDLTFWNELFNQPTLLLVESLFSIIGWAILSLIFFFMGAELWVSYRQSKYTKKWQWSLLAVDIPPLLVQTPKAVEQIFAHLSGAQTGANIGEKYWKGKKQKWFSLEIVSMEGYIQFLIRTEVEFRDLVEASIYAQYPEAEITEVEDYADLLPGHYPNDKYDVFGLDFGLEAEDPYPIRTYPDFQYNLSKDAVFSDPMAAILENFSRIGHGENFWMQIIIEPTGNKWKEKGIELVKELIAGGHHHKESILGSVANVPKYLAQEAINIWDWKFEHEEAHGKEEQPKKISDLTPGGKTTIEAIENKISKIGFKTKVRVMYVAHKEVYNPSRCVDGLIGALGQFSIMSSNALVPKLATKAHYAFADYRTNEKKTLFAGAYKKRKLKAGANPYIMNIEELATLWHFPLPFVKTPFMQKTETKRGEPPMNLPVEVSEIPLRQKKKAAVSEEPPEPPAPPPLEYA
ncbi:MAG: hypothetical protein US58_C0007G0017 [Candidatus Magasanikbacteria bacterium GW2011_GWA2_37_8]|uniref:DUF8128 domain-containing protein n=1 Tax=Candidatus Magasanikbacteria bacterium GW2011_GWA2_37_8 TaxID=1619036 RepID=A0A0G0KK77_9BACT|nr:MAG: hypothetical protein US58_C0007G0017 [Candidatus Magasanikbacteria bacterium GW2011_GWA2_37_8]